MRRSGHPPNWYRRIFFLFTFGMGGLLLFLVVTAEITSQPKFCAQHHYIRPYYESWTRSTHKDVPCSECHFPPGLMGTIERKWKALAEVAIFVTGTYKGEPHAEVKDDGCLRANCHAGERMPTTVEFHGVKFNHQKHLPFAGMKFNDIGDIPAELREKLPRGRALRCTSCHSQLVQGNHMTVTETTCFLCHFKNPPKDESHFGCQTCHKAAGGAFMVNRIRFDHQDFLAKGVPCKQCHTDVVQGDGNVPRERCFQCHDRQERLNRYGEQPFIHMTHVTQHNLDCLNCHTEIQHKIAAMSEAIENDCQKCHLSTQTLYMGIGVGVETSPDPMFLARVSCLGCHSSHEAAGDNLRNVTRANSCAKCHGEEYGILQAQWTQGGKRLIEDFAPRLERAQSALEAARERGVPGAKIASAQALYNAASANLRTVRNGNPVHNVRFSQRLVGASNAQLAMALSLLGSKERDVPIARFSEPKGGNCLSCHFGIETVSKRVYGRNFEHGRHLLNAGLSCETCHSSEPFGVVGHGETPIRVNECMSCHHSPRAKVNCQTCHENLTTQSIAYASKPQFDHKSHAVDRKIACNLCHGSDAKQPFKEECAACHHTKRVALAQKCQSCHPAQYSVFYGKVASASASIHANEGVACSACHPIANGRVATEPCISCHPKGDYEKIRRAWQSNTRAQLAEIARTRRGSSTAEEHRRLFTQDGSLGVHHPELTDTLLTNDLQTAPASR